MDILFVVNPKAGKGRAKKIVPAIENECKKYGVDYEIKYTNAPGDGTDIAAWGVEEGFKKIIAVGGDGTVNEVVNGIAESDAALGVIPGGSGNDFIRSINNHKNIEDIIRDNISGRITKADLGACNGKYFINVASAGFDGEVTIETENAKKIFSGSTAYIMAMLKTIFRYKGRRLRVQIDDLEFEENTLLVAVANGRYYGGGMLPAPNAIINDGYFDICHIKHLPVIKMLFLFPKFMKGKHANIKEVTMFKGKKVRLECTEALAVNLDGEINKASEVEFQIIPNGINIIVPK
jgi:YegS/Rv2252/BmrU family lipid kinase